MILKYKMKEKMLPFAFSKGEIATARAISNSRKLSVQEISIITGKSESSVSQRVKGLETKGIVKTKRQGMKKYVEISDRNYAISLFEMFKAKPYVPWEKILSNSNISVLFKDTTDEETFEYGISPVSIWRGERNLSMHGMFIGTGKRYGNRDRNLIRFISEYSDHVSRKYMLELLPQDAVILWRSGYRCLFKINNNIEKERIRLPSKVQPTAITVFPDYGIQFLTSDSYYYFDPRIDKLSMEDIILHTLLIDPESQTYATYALLLSFKAREEINFELLLDKSHSFRLEEKVKNVIDYIRSHGRKRERPLPRLNELIEQAKLYGIEIN